MKKAIIIFLLITSALCLFKPQVNLMADSGSITSDFEQVVEDVLTDFDFTDYENILNNLDNTQTFFEGDTFLERVKKLISGEYELNFSNILSLITGLLFNSLRQILPTLCTICVLAIVSNLIMQSKSSNSSKSIGDIVHFACFTIIVVLVINVVAGLITSTSSILSSLQQQMEITFPILLTLMASVGSSVSVGVFQPLVAVLSGGLMSFFQNLILPLFIFSLIFNVVGNLSSNVKLNKFCDMFNSIFKTLIGFVFTIFMGFLAIQGISAGSYDGISFKTAKFAIRSYIPFLGGYISDGLGLIITSSVLVKNAIGMGGLLLLFSTILQPLISIIMVMLGFNILASVLQPVADKRTSDFISGVAKSLKMLIATVVGVGFAYLITVGLIMCCSNLIF